MKIHKPEYVRGRQHVALNQKYQIFKDRRLKRGADSHAAAIEDQTAAGSIDCVWCNGEIPAAFGCGCDCHENIHYECSQDNRPEREPR